MTKKQFLLLKLSEECAEVAHQAIKQMQFGKDAIQKDKLQSNAFRLMGEILDLNAIVSLLQEESEIPMWDQWEMLAAKNRKRVKLQKYLNLSASLGQLPEIKL